MIELMFHGTRIYDSKRNLHGTVHTRYNILNHVTFQPETIIQITWDNKTLEKILAINMTNISPSHEIT
jgi:hypothetical protein